MTLAGMNSGSVWTSMRGAGLPSKLAPSETVC